MKPRFKENSIGSHLVHKLLILLGFFSLSVSLLLNLTFYFNARKSLEKQAQIWVKSFPKSIVPHLVDSDYAAISSKVDLLKSTGLFSYFTVWDRTGNVISTFRQTESSSSTPSLYIRDEAGTVWGTYNFEIAWGEFTKPFIISGIVTSLLLFLLFAVASWLLQKTIKMEFSSFNIFLNEIDKLVQKIANSKDVSEFDFKKSFGPLEGRLEHQKIDNAITQLVKEIHEHQKRSQEAIRLVEQDKLKQELSKVAIQVAHDIRSPLAALSLLESRASSFPEDERTIIRSAINRIRDIANNLLLKNKQSNSGTKAGSAQSLAVLVDSIVSEKRLQYRSRLGLEIIANLEHAYGIFAHVDAIEFKRIISNLVDNSVEALGEHGKIELTAFPINKEKLCVLIEDNGKGIPEAILPKLMKKGASFNKPGGSGLGLYHAKTILEQVGGSIEIHSKENKGTRVEIVLSRSEPPLWFVPEVELTPGCEVIIVDDDTSVHQIWQQRLGVPLRHFSSPKDFSEWYVEKSNLDQKSIFLIDYEFLGHEDNGIELIKKHGLATKGFLVTSRFEDPNVMSQVESQNIKLIPKGAVPFIPISKLS